MNPLLISALFGGGLGAAEAYKRSGGDIGQTIGGGLLGTGLGAILPGAAGAIGTRLAGTGLAAKVAPEAYKASQLFARSGASTLNPIGQQALGKAALAKGLGGAALIGGGLAVPALAAGGASLAGKAVTPISKAVGLTQQATGAGMPQLPDVPGYESGQMTPSNLGQFGPPCTACYAYPLGAIQSQLRFEQQQYMQSLQNALRYAPYQEAYQQRSKEADLIRGAKAAQLATALATDAAMRQQGQLGAQRMAEGFMSNIGQAGATQYRYF